MRRSCSIMKHICSLITKAKVVGLAGSAHMALGYDLCLKYRHKNIKKKNNHCVRVVLQRHKNITSLAKESAPWSLDELVTGQH